MLRSLIVLVIASGGAFFFADRSLIYPVLHFILTIFWPLAFFYWWYNKQVRILLSGAIIFAVFQTYFLVHVKTPQTVLLWLLCALVTICLVVVRKIFLSKVKTRVESLAKKNKELADFKEKYGSLQQSLDHLERQVASLLNLFEMAQELSESIDFSMLADTLSKALKQELSFSRAFLWAPARVGESGERYFRSLEFDHDGKSVIQPKVKSPAIILELEEKREMIRSGSIWYIPSFDQNELCSVFGIENADEKDLAKIEVVSSFLALLVKKISLYEMIHELSIVDDLTQVFVRRHFMERLREEIKRSRRFKTPLSLLMLDIDHFKRYNDDFGHLVGDATLKKVSEILRMSVRRVDLVGRYGGEEFIVVMPETRPPEALEVAERIRSSIARHRFKLYHVETKVTVSQGIATHDPALRPSGDDSETDAVVERLIKAADKCLYQAKEDGRNRVIACKELV